MMLHRLWWAMLIDQYIGVIYSHCAAFHGSHTLLRSAVAKLLSSVKEEPAAKVLWHLQYTQAFDTVSHHSSTTGILSLPDVSSSLALEDDVLQSVEHVWRKIVGDEYGDSFMTFEEREGPNLDEETGFENSS